MTQRTCGNLPTPPGRRSQAAHRSPIQGVATETAESRALRWVRPEDVPSLAVEAYAIRVLDGLRNGQPPAVREHDGVNLV